MTVIRESISNNFVILERKYRIIPESMIVPAPFAALNANAFAGMSTIFLPTLIATKFT